MSKLQESIERKRKKEMFEQILNHPIDGEVYINCPPREWKAIILKHFNKVFRGEIGVEELVQVLRRKGVTFQQKDSLIIYPIRNHLLYIAKVTKKDISI